MVLQREVLYSLLGYTGRVVVEVAPGQLELAAGLPLVDASEHALVRRLLVLGGCYCVLDAFVSSQLVSCDGGEDGRQGTRRSRGAYVVAFAHGLDECLQPYRARVLDLEQQLLRSPALSLAALQLGFGEFELTLPALRRLLEDVEHRQLRGVALLDFLHDEVASCTHSLRDALRVLVRHAQRVLRSQLAAWLLHGELLPGDGDFFIERAKPPAAHAHSAAAAAAGEAGAAAAAAANCLERSNASGASPGAGAAAAGTSNAATDDDGAVGWSAFEVDVARKPASLPMRVVERILFIGKAVRVLRASEQKQADAARLALVARDAKRLAAAEADELAPPLSPTSLLTARLSATSPPRLSLRSPPQQLSSVPSPRSPALQPEAAAAAGVGGVASARAMLAAAEASLEAAELRQQQAAVAEVHAEAEGLAALRALSRRRRRGHTGGAVDEGEGPPLEGGVEEAEQLVEQPADVDGRTGRFGSAVLGSAHGLPTGSRASALMRRELEAAAHALRRLPTSDGLVQLAPLEALLARLHRVASSSLWRHLTIEGGLLDLLRAMNGYFLLAKGNVWHTLLEELRPSMAERPNAHLDLSAALLHATSAEPPEPHLHGLRLVLLPSAVPGASAYECWRGLTLTLAVPWPLQLLMHSASIARYSELFRFLLLVKRVQLELQAAWIEQAHFSRLPAEQRALLLPLWRLRAHMAFLIDNLQSYLMVDVLEAQWQSFMRVAETCADFEALAGAHEACLSALHAQCFLQASSVATALHEIFQLCLALCRMLSYADRGTRAEAAYRSQFATVSREFSRQSAFLFAFLSNMSSPQASPHLAQLLLRLNFNSFWRPG